MLAALAAWVEVAAMFVGLIEAAFVTFAWIAEVQDVAACCVVAAWLKGVAVFEGAAEFPVAVTSVVQSAAGKAAETIPGVVACEQGFVGNFVGQKYSK